MRFFLQKYCVVRSNVHSSHAQLCGDIHSPRTLCLSGDRALQRSVWLLGRVRWVGGMVGARWLPRLPAWLAWRGALGAALEDFFVR